VYRSGGRGKLPSNDEEIARQLPIPLSGFPVWVRVTGCIRASTTFAFRDVWIGVVDAIDCLGKLTAITGFDRAKSQC
jgi:hypothetical protein